jgi:hypothetical protein
MQQEDKKMQDMKIASVSDDALDYIRRSSRRKNN